MSNSSLTSISVSEFTRAIREAEQLIGEVEQQDQEDDRLQEAIDTVVAMDNDNAVIKTAKVPQFDSAKSNFQLFWMQFSAYAMLQRFVAVLKEVAEPDLPDNEEEATSDTPAHKAARKRNFMAMYNFTLAFSTEALLSLLYKAQTSEWPGGKAHLVVKELFKKYCPR